MKRPARLLGILLALPWVVPVARAAWPLWLDGWREASGAPVDRYESIDVSTSHVDAVTGQPVVHSLPRLIRPVAGGQLVHGVEVPWLQDHDLSQPATLRLRTLLDTSPQESFTVPLVSHPRAIVAAAAQSAGAAVDALGLGGVPVASFASASSRFAGGGVLDGARLPSVVVPLSAGGNFTSSVQFGGRLGLGAPANPQQTVLVAGSAQTVASVRNTQQGIGSNTTLELANTSVGGAAWKWGSRGAFSPLGFQFLTPAGATALHVSAGGNVTAGGTSAAAPLSVVMGGTGLDVKHDVVPTLRPKTQDGLDGFLRFRHVLEVWPNDEGTQGGKIKVVDRTPANRIELDGESGLVTPSVSLGAQGGSSRWLVPPIPLLIPMTDIRSATVTGRAGGQFIVTASVAAELRTSGLTPGVTMELRSDGVRQAALVANVDAATELNGDRYSQVCPKLVWVVPATGTEQTLSLHVSGNFTGTVKDSHLNATFIPNRLQP